MQQRTKNKLSNNELYGFISEEYDKRLCIMVDTLGLLFEKTVRY